MTTPAPAGHNAKLQTQPLAHPLGAEVAGVNLTAALDDATVDAVLDAWNESHILLFRGQKLSPEALIRFSGRFGDLDRHDATPYYRLAEHPEIRRCIPTCSYRNSLSVSSGDPRHHGGSGRV